MGRELHLYNVHIHPYVDTWGRFNKERKTMTKDPYAPITEGWVSTKIKPPINTEIAQGDIVTVTGFPEVPMLVC